MLGFIGFTIIAIILAGFSLSFYKSFPHLRPQAREHFTIAFTLLAFAFLGWGLAPLLHDATVTKYVVLIGDVLLVLGTGFLISAQFIRSHDWFTILIAVLGAVLIVLRTFAFPSHASVQDGLLLFNLSGVARYVTIGILAFVWMPLGARITQLALASHSASRFSGAVVLVYVASLASAAVFLVATRHEIIILSFAVLAFTFLMLAILPLIINKYQKVLHRAHKVKE